MGYYVPVIVIEDLNKKVLLYYFLRITIFLFNNMNIEQHFSLQLSLKESEETINNKKERSVISLLQRCKRKGAFYKVIINQSLFLQPQKTRCSQIFVYHKGFQRDSREKQEHKLGLSESFHFAVRFLAPNRRVIPLHMVSQHNKFHYWNPNIYPIGEIYSANRLKLSS